MDAPRDFFFFFFLRTSSARGGGGGALPDFFFSFSFSCKVVFFGLATDALNVRNNNLIFLYILSQNEGLGAF